jgi:hypothetical protein
MTGLDIAAPLLAATRLKTHTVAYHNTNLVGILGFAALSLSERGVVQPGVDPPTGCILPILIFGAAADVAAL